MLRDIETNADSDALAVNDRVRVLLLDAVGVYEFCSGVTEAVTVGDIVRVPEAEGSAETDC